MKTQKAKSSGSGGSCSPEARKRGFRPRIVREGDSSPAGAESGRTAGTLPEPVRAGPPLPDRLPANVIPALATRERSRLYRRAMELRIAGRARMGEPELRRTIESVERFMAG